LELLSLMKISSKRWLGIRGFLHLKRAEFKFDFEMRDL
jgi:hypothetical protein